MPKHEMNRTRETKTKGQDINPVMKINEELFGVCMEHLSSI